MVKKLTVNCNFGMQKIPVNLYVGDAAEGAHPLDFQSRWLSSTKGGAIPEDIMEAFSKLKAISDKNRIPFEDLCAYVIDEINMENEVIEENKKVNQGLSNFEDKKSKKT